MAVTLTGTGGLFPRLGVYFGGIRHLNGVRAETAAVGVTDDASAVWGLGGAKVKDAKSLVTDITAQFLSTRQTDIINIWSARDNFRSSVSSLITELADESKTTLIGMVNDDAILPVKDLATSMGELLRQMRGAGTFINADNDVDASTVSVSAAAQTQPANTGNPTLVATVRGIEGYTLEGCFAEVLEATVTDDSGTGATAGSESIAILGEASESDPLNWNWPDGSGASKSMTMVDPTGNATNGNLLYNSDFNDFTVSNTPDYFGILVGAAGTDIFREATTVYRTSSNCLKFTGTGAAPLSSVSQKFDVTTPATATNGTSSELKPNTIYIVNCQMAKESGLVAGVVVLSLLDQAGTPAVVNDDQAVANTISQTCSALATSFGPVSGVFITPKVLPSTGLQIAVRLTTALTNTKSLYVADLALTEVGAGNAVELYTRGPSAAMFRGSTDVAKGDKINITVANNYAGLFQLMFDQVFDMKALGLQLPSDTAAGETIVDTLIT